jgi:hypothetical protein
LFEISFRVKLTSACYFRKIGLFSLTLMTALSLGRGWRTLTLLSHCSMLVTRNFNLLIKAIDKYLGLMICDVDSNTFKISQPLLICWILELLSLDEHKTKGCDTLVGKQLLHLDLDGVPCKHPSLYCGAVSMLSYLGNSVRPDIQMAVYQRARLSVNLMRLHKLAIMHIGQYLCNNCECGIIYKVNKSKGIEVYVDTDFAGG